MSKPVYLSILSMIAAAAAVLMVAATDRGLGLTPDSVYYLRLARNLNGGAGYGYLTGDGAPVPQDHFPPGYPLALAALMRAGMDINAAARVLAVALMAANVLLTGAVTTACAAGRRGAGLLGAALAAGSIALWGIHIHAWSEPLGLSLMLAGSLALEHGLRTRQGLALATAGLLFGLTPIVRWAFLPIPLAGLIVIIFPASQPPQTRWRSALMYSPLAVIPLGLWLARNLAVFGRASDRVINYAPLTLEKFRSVIHIPGTWGGRSLDLPWGSASSWLAAGVLAAWIAVAAAAALKNFRASMPSRPTARPPGDAVRRAWRWFLDRPIRRLALVIPAVYLPSLLLSILFVDRTTPLDNRLLSPIYVPTLALAIAAAAALLDAAASRLAWRAAAGAGILAAALQVVPTLALVQAARNDPSGYAARAFRESKIGAAVRSLPAGARIVSNDCAAVDSIADRPTTELPWKEAWSVATPRAGARQPPVIAALRRWLSAGDGYVVLWQVEPEGPDSYMPSESQIRGLLPLEVVVRTDDGVILRLAPGPTTKPD